MTGEAGAEAGIETGTGARAVRPGARTGAWTVFMLVQSSDTDSKITHILWFSILGI